MDTTTRDILKIMASVRVMTVHIANNNTLIIYVADVRFSK